jgi:Short C-terminal domain
MADRCPRCNARGFTSPQACVSCGWQDPRLESWVPTGWYPDPLGSGAARWWDQARESWIGSPRANVAAQPVPTSPPPEWKHPDPEDREVVRVAGCRVLGGHGMQIGIGQTCDLVGRSVCRDHRAGDRRAGRARKQGGGFAGFGFGLQGAAEGILVATALNLLTTKTRTDTVICLQTASAEAFFHNGSEPPDAMRIRLSPVFSVLRQQNDAARHQLSPGDESPSGSVVDRLSKLADLLDKGLITADEFANLKADLLQ